MKLNVLDLDGTLTKADTLVAYSKYMLLYRRRVRFLLVLPLLLLLRSRIIDNPCFKRLYARWILRGYSAAYLQGTAIGFVDRSEFNQMVNQEVLAFVERLGAEESVIVTANYSFLAKRIAERLGIGSVVGVDLECLGGQYTGNVVGRVPFGREKIAALKEFVGQRQYEHTIGLGDSESDLGVLRTLDRGYMVSFSRATGATEFRPVGGEMVDC